MTRNTFLIFCLLSPTWIDHSLCCAEVCCFVSVCGFILFVDLVGWLLLWLLLFVFVFIFHEFLFGICCLYPFSCCNPNPKVFTGACNFKKKQIQKHKHAFSLTHSHLRLCVLHMWSYVEMGTGAKNLESGSWTWDTKRHCRGK